ncbi:hypothetical protein ACFLXO_07200 [Chloroflexota bacterium]
MARVPLFVGRILLIVPSTTFELIGFDLLVAGLVVDFFDKKATPDRNRC